jgi:hypothetical protein
MSLRQQYNPDAHVIRAIMLGIRGLLPNIRLTINHINGHQDRGKAAQDTLKVPAQLNIIADQLATEGLNMKKVADTTFPGNFIEVKINNLLVNTHTTKALRTPFNGIKMHQHFKETYKWTDNTIGQIFLAGTWQSTKSIKMQTKNYITKNLCIIKLHAIKERIYIISIVLTLVFYARWYQKIQIIYLHVKDAIGEKYSGRIIF